MNLKRHAAVSCAIYTRYCSADHEEQRKSHREQRDACVAFVASQRERGWRLLRTRYVDDDSGASVQSPVLHRLLDLVRMGKVQVVVVYRLEHLSANLLEFAKIIEVLYQHDVSLVAISQKLNSREPEGRVALNVLLSFASFEKKRTSETPAKIGGVMPPKPSLSGKPPGYEKYLERAKDANSGFRHTIRIEFVVVGPERKKAFLSWARKGFRFRKPAASQPLPIDPAQAA
jgi:DNA invertase Pin-like site-specific DNA recombinase